MNPNSNTSFFDEPVEDESITLNEDELNNILEEGTSVVPNEPDVIVIEKERLAPTLDLSDSAVPDSENLAPDDSGFSDADIGASDTGYTGPVAMVSDEVSAASELMTDSSSPRPEETLYVEPGFEDDTGASGITDASEISEITAFNDASTNPESASETILSDETPEPAAASAVPELITVDEEISLTGEELENIVASAPAAAEGIEEAEKAESEGVVFTDEPAAAVQGLEVPAEIEEISTISEIPESTSAEEIEFERLDAEELPSEPLETLSEVEPIELAASDEELSDDSGVTLVEGLEETSPVDLQAGETLMATDEPSEISEAPRFDQPEIKAQTPATEETPFGEVEEISLDEPAAAEPVFLQQQTAAETDNLKLYADETAPSSFFSESDEDEAITLNTDELNNILTNADVEEIDEEKTAAAASVQLSDLLTGPLSRDNLKEIFVYLDNLLDKLPDSEIKRFAESQYYDLYNQIFEELDIV